MRLGGDVKRIDNEDIHLLTTFRADTQAKLINQWICEAYTEGEVHAMERNAEAIDNLYDIVHARPLSVWERILIPLRRTRQIDRSTR
jgi:hypothetical protein